MKKVLSNYLTFIVLLAVAFGLYSFRDRIFQKSTPTIRDLVKKVKPRTETQPKGDREIVADNLDIPWELEFLPNDEILLTERPGRVLKIGKDRKIIEISGVSHVGEGGLLGLALHPKFEDNNLLYLYLTTEEGGDLANRVEQYRLAGDALTDRKVILSGIEGASNHDGGRIAFGPDGFLYIATGDAQNTALSQNRNSLNGKILRVNDNGSIPTDNPFGNAVYSYGHRNIQGLAWDRDGRLWATEHGRSGIQSGLDELNLIEKGKNYGWPTIQGDEARNGMIKPAIHSGGETWAPSGATYVDGSVFFAGLRGETLYEAQLSNETVTSLKKHLQGEYGRLRTVKLGPGGYLYILTNNRDGRGSPKTGDDKLLRIDPKTLQ